MSRNTQLFRVVRFVQIYHCIFFAPIASAFGFGDRLVPGEDTILINFPRRPNGTRVATRYLPPETTGFPLPEVIDNRARNAINDSDTAKHEIDDTAILDAESQTPTRNGPRESRFYQRPVFLRAKHAPFAGTQGNYLQESETSSGTVKITDMSCQNTGDQVYFRATIRAPKSLDPPVVEHSTNDICKGKKVNDDYKIDFNRDHFWNCGILDCSTETGKSYCLSLRFPVISGLRLKEDFKITLQCKAQERTASHTKRINVKTLDTAARMTPNMVTGGFRNSLDTEVGLYRKTYNSENVFDTRIQSGGTVVLGEEILLRVLVREGDGWRYSRISDVTVHYVESRQRKKVTNSVRILDGNGCLNPEVREICSREQYKVSPLESYLIFQAFMFEGMKETDEMVLSVKVTGCSEGADCALNCPAGHSRRARSVDETRNSTFDWRDDIAFRVVYTEDKVDDQRFRRYLVIPYVFLTLSLLVVSVLLWTIKVLLRQRALKA